MRSGLRRSLVSAFLVALLSGCSSPSQEPVPPVPVPEPQSSAPAAPQSVAEELKSYYEIPEKSGRFWKRIYDGGAVIELIAKEGRLVQAALTPEMKHQ